MLQGEGVHTGAKITRLGRPGFCTCPMEEGQENSLAIRTKMMFKSSEWHQIKAHFGSVYAQLWGLLLADGNSII